jgi:hypothetical protein
MASDRMLIIIDSGLCPLFKRSSMSKYHKDRPWGMDVNGQHYDVGYWPGDSQSGMFGGNSNWRGPICESGSLGLAQRRI